jgi:hypothetical protein
LQGDSVSVATALSPATGRPFQVFISSAFCRIRVNWCVKHRIGLWIVTDGPIIELVPYRQLTPNNNYRNDIIRRLERWDETIVGGVPNRLGIGVAQDVQRRVDEYRAANPGATWKEIYSKVPSHYDSYRSMYSLLRSNAERLAWRKRVLDRAKKISATVQQGATMPQQSRNRLQIDSVCRGQIAVPSRCDGTP